MARRTRILYLAMAVCSVLATSSCFGRDGASTPPDTQEAPPWSISFRWSADPGIDLSSEDSQVVRAAIESNTIAEFLSPEYGYPGWREKNYKAENNNLAADMPHPMREGVGTAYLHIVPLQTPSGLLTIVCKDMSETATNVDGKYPLPHADNRKETFEAISVSVSGNVRSDSTSDPGRVPTGPQIPGQPERKARPTNDVFTRYAYVNYQYDLNTYRDLCNPWLQGRWGGDHPPKSDRGENVPPKVESFSPGWL